MRRLSRHNEAAIKAQLSIFLDFDSDAPNAAKLVNNYDWMKDFTFLDFIRDVGKHITVNYMMSKDSVRKRISGEEREGMSFTEFTYQLVQGYDFLWLYEHEGCKLQMGGSDQWGNITTGTELIRRKLSERHLPNLSPDYKGRWRQVRQDGTGKCLARRKIYLSLYFLPILAQCER